MGIWARPHRTPDSKNVLRGVSNLALDWTGVCTVTDSTTDVPDWRGQQKPNLHKDGRLVLRLNGLVSKGWDDECVHSAEIVKQVASLFRLDRKRSSIAGQELERD